MVHPSELLRTNSTEGRQFSAPVNITYDNPIDCGFTKCANLNHLLNLEKFAKLSIYVTILSIVGFLYGANIYFFRGTSLVWARHYNISQSNADWLIYTNEFFIGIFGIIVAYWGNKIHRISWIGGLTVFHSISCLILIIPEIQNQDIKNHTTSGNLCQSQYIQSETEDINYIALAVLIIFQIVFAMASVSFISHGITYLDDNTVPKNSPALIGIVLAAQELGKQAGIYLSTWPLYTSHEKKIFVSGIWICLSITTFIIGLCIAMFPKYLPSIVMERISASILNIASGCTVPRKEVVVDGFFKSLGRLLSNKVLVFNIFHLVFIQSALVSLNIFEKVFNQVKFYVSSNHDTTLMQLPKYLLQQPLVAICIVATGMVIARTQPKTKAMVTYNIIISILIIIVFSSTSFFNCNKYELISSNSYCNKHCNNCQFSDFQPICIKNRTYFSPCCAGCSSIKNLNNAKIYYNCTCGDVWFEKGNFEATDGPCDYTKCSVLRILYEVNSIINMGLLASIFITNLTINLRSVLKKDKALALGLQVTFLGLVPYLPVKIVYEVIVDKLCQWNNGKICKNPIAVGTFLSTSTVILIAISVIIGIITRFFINFANELEDIVQDEDHDFTELDVIPQNQMLLNPNLEGNNVLDFRIANSLQNSKYSLQDSLADMENIGDDHDSIGSLDIERSSRN